MSMNAMQQATIKGSGERLMKARQLIDNASFGPAALKVIGQAFDEAWVAIAANFSDTQKESPGRGWPIRYCPSRPTTAEM
jgi:hypothetical protein